MHMLQDEYVVGETTTVFPIIFSNATWWALLRFKIMVRALVDAPRLYSTTIALILAIKMRNLVITSKGYKYFYNLM